MLFWRLSLLLFQDLSATIHSVIQATRLNEVPLTEMYWPVEHLVLSLLFHVNYLMLSKQP